MYLIEELERERESPVFERTVLLEERVVGDRLDRLRHGSAKSMVFLWRVEGHSFVQAGEHVLDEFDVVCSVTRYFALVGAVLRRYACNRAFSSVTVPACWASPERLRVSRGSASMS